MTSTPATSVKALFSNAVAEGSLSQAAAMQFDVRDIGGEINDALGVSVDDVQASEVVIVTDLVDDSTSIRFVNGNTEAVRNGHNLLIKTLRKQKRANAILASTTLLNRGLLRAYVPVAQAVELDSSNYNPSGGTPLYDRSIVVLGSVIAKAQEFLDNGVACRCITIIVTDGGDNGGLRGADKVGLVVADMLKAENHIVAGVGIFDGQKDANNKPIPGTGTDFREVFRAMGIRDEWILTPDNTEKEILAAFALLSQSASQASQNAGSFAAASATGLGGFGS